MGGGENTGLVCGRRYSACLDWSGLTLTDGAPLGGSCDAKRTEKRKPEKQQDNAQRPQAGSTGWACSATVRSNKPFTSVSWVVHFWPFAPDPVN